MNNNIINRGTTYTLYARGEDLVVDKEYTAILFYSSKREDGRAITNAVCKQEESIDKETKEVVYTNVCEFIFMQEETTKLLEGNVSLEIYDSINKQQMYSQDCYAFVRTSSLVDPEYDKEKTLIITKNGQYVVKHYDQVSISVLPSSEEQTLNITENGTYTVEPVNTDALSKVTVNAEFNLAKAMAEEGYKFAYNTQLLTFDYEVTLPSDSSYLFYNCTKLSEVNVSKIDTSKVTNYAYMFQGCSSLTRLDEIDWDVSNVSMTGMFQNTSFQWLDLHKMKPSELRNVFNHSNSIKTIIGDHTLEEVINGDIICFEGAKRVDLDGLTNARYSSILACLKGMNNLSETVWMPSNAYNNCFNDDDTVPDASTLAERQAEIKAICAQKNKSLTLG